jgi:hypothetical protein
VPATVDVKCCQIRRRIGLVFTHRSPAGKSGDLQPVPQLAAGILMVPNRLGRLSCVAARLAHTVQGAAFCTYLIRLSTREVARPLLPV